MSLWGCSVDAVLIRVQLRQLLTYFNLLSVLNHCLEWDTWALTNFDHDRQWFNTCILSHLRELQFHTVVDPWGYQYVIPRQTSTVDIGSTSAMVEYCHSRIWVVLKETGQTQLAIQSMITSHTWVHLLWYKMQNNKKSYECMLSATVPWNAYVYSFFFCII